MSREHAAAGENALVDPNTRQGKRTPVTLKIKFKSETLEQFIERYAVDVSQGGIFIRTKEPLAVGTQMKFEFQLRDASPLIAGEGTVVWTRENDPSRPAIAPGMGVRFDRLADGSQSVLERILAEKAKQAPQRGANESTTKPPMFTDTPTRVAPAPVQDALLGNAAAAATRRRDSETDAAAEADAVPLGRRRVRRGGVRGGDEGPLARRAGRADRRTDAAEDRQMSCRRTSSRRGARISDVAARRSARRPRTTAGRPSPIATRRPGLPSPPEPRGRAGRLLDTTPSPRADRRSSRRRANLPLGAEHRRRTQALGLEPAKAPTSPHRDERPSAQRAARGRGRAVAADRAEASEQRTDRHRHPRRGRRGGRRRVVLRAARDDEVAPHRSPTRPAARGSAVATDRQHGSAGSAVARLGSGQRGQRGGGSDVDGAAAARSSTR